MEAETMIGYLVAALFLVLMAAFDIAIAVKSGSPIGWFAAAGCLAMAVWNLTEARRARP